MALGDIVQVGTRAGSGGASSFSPTLGVTATAGNLLVAYGTVTVGGRTATTPAGWTAGPETSAGTNFSSHIFWKESDGTETGVTINLSGSGGGYYNIIEIDATGADLTALDASAEDETNIDTAVSSQTTGTANGTDSNGVAVAFWGVNIGGTVDTGRAYTNSFVERDTSDLGNTSRGGYFLASKVITGTSNESTWSNTEGTEPAYGAILVFGAGAARGITDINGDDAIDVGETGATITGQGFDLPISSVTLGGEALTVTGTPTATSIKVTCPTNIDLRWGRTDLTLTVTDNTGALNLANVTLNNRSGWGTIDLATLHATNNDEGNPIKSYRTEALIDLSHTAVVGEQLQHETNAALTVDGEWIPRIEPAQDVTTTYAIFNDTTGRTAEASVTWQDIDAGGGGGETGTLTYDLTSDLTYDLTE